MRYVGLRRRPALAGADELPTRQARELWNAKAFGNARALGLGNTLGCWGLQGRVLYIRK